MIPEELVSDARRLAAALSKYGLPPDLDLNGDENIVPSCSHCNGKKSNLELGVAPMAIHLAVTKRKAPQIARFREKYGRQILTNKLVLNLIVRKTRFNSA